ncbi:MAG: signal peptidase II [Bryobacteraceae bacterium]
MPTRLVPFAIAFAVFAVDRLTKAVIERAVSFWDALVVIPGFFQIIHTQNKGAAFSMLADASETVRTVVLVGLSVVVLGFIATLLWRTNSPLAREHPSVRVGLSLVLGGAVGNVFDRITRGGVTDFLDFYAGDYHFPTFNVADSAITIGAGLLLLSMWLTKRDTVRTDVSKAN